MSEITLRTFSEEEYHDFFRHYEPDPWTSPPYRYDREQVSRSYRYNHGGFRPDYAHFGVFEGNEPVGSFQLKRIDPEKKTCEFGIILLNEEKRGRGIGPEAIRLGLEIARDRYHVDTVYGDTMGRNERMRRVFLKTGFEQIETVKDAFTLWNGEKEDRLVFRIRLSAPKEEC